MPKRKIDGVRLTNLIAPAFYPVHWDVRNGLHTYYDLYGGRGSTKSSFISVEIVMGIMEDPAANAAVFRKVANTIGISVFEQVLWAINALGAEDLWKPTINPYKVTYKPTGQVILFRGLDKAKKLKSNWPIDFGGLEVFISPVVAIDDSAIGNHLAIGKSNPERLHEFAICQCGDSGHRTEHDFPF